MTQYLSLDDPDSCTSSCLEKKNSCSSPECPVYCCRTFTTNQKYTKPPQQRRDEVTSLRKNPNVFQKLNSGNLKLRENNRNSMLGGTNVFGTNYLQNLGGSVVSGTTFQIGNSYHPSYEQNAIMHEPVYQELQDEMSKFQLGNVQKQHLGQEMVMQPNGNNKQQNLWQWLHLRPQEQEQKEVQQQQQQMLQQQQQIHQQEQQQHQQQYQQQIKQYEIQQQRQNLQQQYERQQRIQQQYLQQQEKLKQQQLRLKQLQQLQQQDQHQQQEKLSQQQQEKQLQHAFFNFYQNSYPDNPQPHNFNNYNSQMYQQPQPYRQLPNLFPKPGPEKYLSKKHRNKKHYPVKNRTCPGHCPSVCAPSCIKGCCRLKRSIVGTLIKSPQDWY